MTASTSMSLFHQWLMADPAGNTLPRAIVLHCNDSRTSDHLVEEIADYLNEYDDDGDSYWLPATSELVEKISCDTNHLKLLDIVKNDSIGSARSETGFQMILAALGRRGHAVYRSPCIPGDQAGTGHNFHAGVGPSGEVRGKCHVILDSELMERKCIAHTIADVFLEWIHCESRHNTPIREVGGYLRPV
jgi:hypothetical protein